MNQILLAAIEFAFIIAALILLFPFLGWSGLVGLFFAFVGFELHLIWHRRDNITRAAKKNKEQQLTKQK